MHALLKLSRQTPEAFQDLCSVFSALHEVTNKEMLSVFWSITLYAAEDVDAEIQPLFIHRAVITDSCSCIFLTLFHK